MENYISTLDSHIKLDLIDSLNLQEKHYRQTSNEMFKQA